MKKETRLYNILFPVWMLVWLPSYLWIFLIPANYLIDRFVLKKSLSTITDKDDFLKKHTWKICIAGFFSDLIGSLAMFGSLYVTEKDNRLVNAISFDPFSDLRAFLFVSLMVFVSAVLIYFIDKKILLKAGLEETQARRSALYLAVFTAPYMFLFSSRWLYY
ncbi:MAG: hypothetical protein K5648_10720 [Erysipelotrichaceae bacterium]|nr:hypothetical protein [Erysipelotrichaceae bacterium]